MLASGASDERADLVFDAVGAQTLWLGEAGRGTRLKLVVNYWILGQTALTAQTIALAERLGIGGDRFLKLIRGTFTDSPYAQAKGAKMLARDHAPSFGLAEEMSRAIVAGHGDEDISAVIEAINGGTA